MNAGLQCLINMPSICQHFFENMSLPIKSTQEVNLSTPFRDLLFEVWGRRRTDFRPVTFKDSLASKYSQFEGFRQHDCQEFLALLLNSLHEELNLKKPGSHTAYDNSRGDGRYHNRGDIGAASGHNGATNSNIGAPMEEELDEDELRKIEHKNQDEQPTSLVTSSVLVDSADMESESVVDSFAQKLSSSSILPPDSSQRNDKISQSFDCGGFTSGEALRSWSNKKQLNEDIFDERQDSPSNVMKKMKLDDGCCDVSMSPRGTDFGMDLVKDKDSAMFNKESFMGCHESMMGGATGNKKGSAVQDESKLVWDKYLDENQSIIAQTFQGQFRSTICCAFCYHKSVTYEPFMYLPVPLPHALERQVTVLFVPPNVNESRRHLLVTVNKHGTVTDVRKQLMSMLNDPHLNNSSAELVLAVGGKRKYTSSYGSVERILEDTNKLMHVPESSFFYAFKIFNTDDETHCNPDGTHLNGDAASLGDNSGLTVQSVGGATGTGVHGGRGERDDACRDEEDVERRDDNQGEEHGENDVTRQPEERSVEVAKWKQCCICLDDRFISDVRVHNKCGAALCHTCFDRTVETNSAAPSAGGFGYGDMDGTGQTDIDQTLGAFEDYDAYTGPTYGPEPCSQTSSSSTMTPDVSVGTEADSMAVDSDPQTPVPPENSQSSEDLPSGDVIEMGDVAVPGDTGVNSSEERGGTADKSTAPIRCPMCNSLSDEADFVCFGKESEGVVRSARLMMMTVVYRVNSDEARTSFGGMTSSYISSCFDPIDWPRMMYVFDNISTDDLRTRIRKEMLPLSFAPDEQFKLFRTENCGTKCSRCYKSSCDCSLIETGSASCDFIPGDTICVELTLEEGASVDSLVSKFSPVEEHESMSERRPKNAKLSLMECVEAFTAGEVLDENNPWWCPQCQANRSATKQIQLWRMPETLVIYLKRFYFDNLTSYKLENVVECPETLDLRSICSDNGKQQEIDRSAKDTSVADFDNGGAKKGSNGNELDSSFVNCNSEGSRRSNLYQLQSCVCHVGNANAGHYTAYARNPLSGLWYYFNDETVSLKEPKYDDSPEIYILFYQRRDRTYHLDVPSNLESFLPAPTDDTMAGSLTVATLSERDGGSSTEAANDTLQKTYSQSSVSGNSTNNLAVERLVTSSHRPDLALSSSSSGFGGNSTQLVRVEEETESMTSSVTTNTTLANQGQDGGEEARDDQEGEGLRVAGDTYKLMQPHAQASLDVSSSSFCDYGRHAWPPPTGTPSPPSPSGGNDYKCGGSGGDVFFIP